jgi:hypothetical protein
MGFDLTAALPFVEEQVLQDGRGNATGEKFLWVDWVDGFDVVRIGQLGVATDTMITMAIDGYCVWVEIDPVLVLAS